MTNLLRDLPLRKIGHLCEPQTLSWKNPDASMDDIDIEDYMDLGPLEASDV